jgi:hypothetical protein
MNTIVTAFINNVNNRYTNTIDVYYNYGKLLLKSNVPKVIFVDEDMYNLIGNNYEKNNTLIIKINKNSMYFYEHINELTNFQLNTDNPSKDTIEFMFIMCNKTEWVKKAIELNHFDTNNFIWLDFGIKNVISYTDEEFVKKIDNLKYQNYDKVRIGGIWNLSNYYGSDLCKDITWYFAGGIFGGNQISLLKFARLMKNKCIHIMTTYKTIMWEVNIWYIIYNENKELFDVYNCNHNNTIIDNY